MALPLVEKKCANRKCRATVKVARQTCRCPKCKHILTGKSRTWWGKRRHG